VSPVSRARRAPSPPRLHARWRARVDDFAVDADVGPAGVAVASASGKLSVFDLADGAVRWARDAHDGGVLATAWHPRAGLLASAGQDGKARLWDASGGLLAEVADDAAWVEQLAWSPNGEYLAIGAGRTVLIVRPSGGAVARVGPHASTITGLAWNRRGDRLAASHYGGVTIWTARTGNPVRTLAWKGSMISLAWSPDGQAVACGEQDASVHFWRLVSGEDARMGGYSAKVRSLAWDVQSSRLATAGEPDVIVWDFRGAGPEGTQPLQLVGHRELVGVVDFASRGLLLASGAADGSVAAWDLARTDAPLLGFGAHDGAVSRIAWTGTSREILGTDATGGIALWILA
jgi:WD40 repeat protein